MGSLSPALIALGAAGLLGLLTRWVFRPARPNSHPTMPVNATEAADLGLLVVVMSGMTRDDAQARRATLGDAGIRSSISARSDGTVDVLVFRGDADKARIVLGP